MEEFVTPRLLASIGIASPPISNKRGGSRFWADAPRINASASKLRIFGLADLEQTSCAPDLIARHLPQRNAGFSLRLAVRMVESWLLADSEAVSIALSVPRNRVPAEPDLLLNPKESLVNLARTSSRASVRSALVPRERSGAHVGPDYLAFMSRFVEERWRPQAAAARSPSLARALKRLQEVKAQP